jgi:hypothetical protein
MELDPIFRVFCIERFADLSKKVLDIGVVGEKELPRSRKNVNGQLRNTGAHAPIRCPAEYSHAATG